ncbi:MAG TPA: hypothetical protein VF022_09610, partial [Rhodanobacteraceae bacterium]
MVRTITLSLLALASLLAASTAFAGHRTACSGPAYRQFDFFAGDWDAYDLDAPGKPVARNHVEIVLNGCVIHEDYQQGDGLHGESYSLYDSARDVWHQSWVTNRGGLLLMDGGWHDGRMTFEGDQAGQSGKSARVRVAWIPQGENVRETAARSLDGGRSWQPLFDMLFKPHRH